MFCSNCAAIVYTYFSLSMDVSCLELVKYLNLYSYNFWAGWVKVDSDMLVLPTVVWRRRKVLWISSSATCLAPPFGSGFLFLLSAMCTSCRDDEIYITGFTAEWTVKQTGYKFAFGENKWKENNKASFVATIQEVFVHHQHYGTWKFV